ncbi:uncharacterized protein LOC134024805 [Osmerus eperlanus]|uniref:uncharacterized protein LOC134024805 n=1 Tax=Osmerus eperlanus TaxID=29151 RepID=UPI002E1408B8
MEIVVVKLEDEERPCTEISPEEDDKQFLANTIRSIKTQTQDNTCLESNTFENVTIEHDVKPRNIEENKAIWRRRSTLVNKISKAKKGKRRLEQNMRCKKIGIDLDVGSGFKQKLDLQLLTNGVMKEIAEFADELSTIPQKHYIAEILEYNFNISFENSKQKNEFANQTWQRLVELQKRHAQKPFELSMLNQPWMLGLKPYYMVTKTSSQRDPIRDSGIITSEHLGYAEICVESESDMMANQDIKVEKFYTVSEETRADLYPLCQEIGLDLDVTYKGWCQEKLDMDVLTKGVMIEVAKYTKKLCGTYKQIVLDILEHNFDIDLQTVDSELFRRILYHFYAGRLNKKQRGQAWYETAISLQKFRKWDRKLAPAVSKRQSERQKKRQLSAADGDEKKRESVTQSAGTSERNFKKRTCKFSSFERTDQYNNETADVGQMDGLGYMYSLENPGLEPSLTVVCPAGGGHVSSPAPSLTPSYDTHTALCAEEVKLQDNNNMKARFDYYPFCEQSGIDLDVYSKLESKEKRDLQFLTNGVMFEIHKYVNRNRKKKGYLRFLYDILEYNFDMSFHNQKWPFFITRLLSDVKRLAKKYNYAVVINPSHAINVFALYSKIPTVRKKKEMVTLPARTSERIFKKTCKLSNFERTNPCTDGTADIGQMDDLGYMCSLENPGLEPLLTEQANVS